jgi:hypothetical protein
MPATADNVLTFAACDPWADAAKATPLHDFRCVRLLGKGGPYRYDRTARAFLSYRTLGFMLGNTNAADLYGRGRADSLPARAIFYEDDLPRLVACEPEYGPPDGRVIVVPAAGDGRDPERASYALRPVGDPPPGVLIMCV